MRARRWIGGAGIAIALLGVGWWTTEAERPASPATPPAMVPGSPPVRNVTSTPPASPEPRAGEPLQSLSQSCQLTASRRCDGAVCATVLVMPDLDRLGGWLTLARQSPGFVATVALRDLGLPLTAMPCAHAIDDARRGGVVHAVELPSGAEVWCSVHGATATAGRSPAPALCNGLAESLVGPHAAQFEREDLRTLTL